MNYYFIKFTKKLKQKFICSINNLFVKFRIKDNMSLRFCDKVLEIIIITIIMLVFSTGVFESLYADKYIQYKDSCGILQTQIFVFSIIDLVTGILSLIICASIIQIPVIENPILVVFVVEFFIGIWAGTTYHQIGDVCYDFWITKAPELLTFNIIHYMLFWILVAIICVSGFRSCSKKKFANTTGQYSRMKYGSINDDLHIFSV